MLVQDLAQTQERSLGPIVLCIREKIIQFATPALSTPCPQHPFYSQKEAGQKEEERQLMVLLGRETPIHLTLPFSSPKSLPIEPPCPHPCQSVRRARVQDNTEPRGHK